MRGIDEGDDPEALACVPAPVQGEGFNPTATLPYGLSVPHLRQAMEDFTDFLGFLNQQLHTKEIERLEQMLMPANFSSMVGEFMTSRLPRYCPGLVKNRYHNGHPDLVPAGRFPGDAVQHASEGIEVKASRYLRGWQGHNPEECWLLVFVFDSNRPGEDRERVPPKPFRFLAVFGAALTEDDWRFAGRSATSRRTITASVTTTRGPFQMMPSFSPTLYAKEWSVALPYTPTKYLACRRRATHTSRQLRNTIRCAVEGDSHPSTKALFSKTKAQNLSGFHPWTLHSERGLTVKSTVSLFPIFLISALLTTVLILTGASPANTSYIVYSGVVSNSAKASANLKRPSSPLTLAHSFTGSAPSTIQPVITLPPKSTDKLWSALYRAQTAETADMIIPTAQGYLLAGVTTPWDGVEVSIWLLEIDPDGEIIWERTYGGQEIHVLETIYPTDDGGFMVVARVDPYESYRAPYLMKLDGMGNIIWQKSYPIQDGGWAMGEIGVAPTPDGGTVLAGYVVGANATVLKIDADGEITWHKTYDHSYFDSSIPAYVEVTESLNAIKPTSDGGYIASGSIYYRRGERHSHGTDIWIVKLTATGNVLWEKSFDRTSKDYPDSLAQGSIGVQELGNGGYLINGYTEEPLAFPGGTYSIIQQAFLIKLDEVGGFIWGKHYYMPPLTINGDIYVTSNQISSIKPTADGNYIGVGNSGNSAFNAWLLKIDGNGDIIWQKFYGLPDNSGIHQFNDFLFTEDNSLVISGFATTNAHYSDMWVLKTDINGNAGDCDLGVLEEPFASAIDIPSITHAPATTDISTLAFTTNITNYPTIATNTVPDYSCVPSEPSDTTPPSGEITAPQDGSTTSASSIIIQANASDGSDGSGVKRVRFYVFYNSSWQHVIDDYTTPYEVTWDVPSGTESQLISFGLHVEDNAGNYVVDPTPPITVTYVPSSVCHSLSLTPVPHNGGTITNLTPYNCLNGYLPGTEVEIHADAASGYRFTGWSDAASGQEGNIKIIMDGNIHVVASFETGRPAIVLVHGFLGSSAANHVDTCTFNQTLPFHYSADPGSRDDGVGGRNIDYFNETPHRLHNSYDVWIAHVASGPTDRDTPHLMRTPPIIENGACLAGQLEYIYRLNRQPIILVAHSMGGAVSRACISRNIYSTPNCRMVAQLITLGTPHAGVSPFVEDWAIEKLNALTAHPGLIELTQSNVVNFNNNNRNRRAVNYAFLGGTLRGLGGDGVAATYSLLGWSKPDGTTNPTGWDTVTCPSNNPCNSLPAHLTTDEGHTDYFADRDGDASHAYQCIEWYLTGEIGSPPASCRPVPADTQAYIGMGDLVETPFLEGTILPGTHDTRTIGIDMPSPATFQLTSAEPGLQLTLVRPDGLIIDPAYATTHSSEVRYTNIPPSATVLGQSSYVVTDTMVGDWRLIISNDKLEPISYLANAKYLSTRTLRLGTDGWVVSPGSTMVLNADLSDITTGIEDATVVGELLYSNGITDTLTFAPQGNGLYQATYAVSFIPGYLYVRVTAYAQIAEVSFARKTTLILGIQPQTAQLIGSYSDTALDLNGDGIYDTLDINVGVNTPSAGLFTLNGELVVGNRRIAQSSELRQAEPGANILTLRFAGEDIAQAAIDGPYTLTNVSLSDLNYGEIPLVIEEDVWLTQAYRASDFGSIVSHSLYLPLIQR